MHHNAQNTSNRLIMIYHDIISFTIPCFHELQINIMVSFASKCQMVSLPWEWIMLDFASLLRVEAAKIGRWAFRR